MNSEVKTMDGNTMKQSCAHLVDLSPYMDGELSTLARDQVKAHLSDCAECNERLGQLIALRRDVAELGNVTVGFERAYVKRRRGSWIEAEARHRDLAPRLRHRLRVSSQVPAPWSVKPWRWLPLSLAATISTVVFGVFLGSALMHASDGVAGTSTSAMSLFDPIPPGGICLSVRPCRLHGKS
jgi:anti-sigma factor RsiW